VDDPLAGLFKRGRSGYTPRSLRLAVLASGSAGNSTFVEAAGTRLLIDAGLGSAETSRRLARIAGRPRLAGVDAVLLTHEHSDHAQGAAALAGMGMPLFATAPTAAGARVEANEIWAGREFSIGSIRVCPVALPHDAAGPVAFVVEAEGVRMGVLTDLGEATQDVREAFSGCDVIVLETNHDERWLLAGPYPPFLKRRIAGRLGHLSNEQAAEFVRSLHPPPRCLLLAHLSLVNNRPRLARAACAAALGRRRVEMVLTHQHRVSPVVTAMPASLDVRPASAGEQLDLFAVMQ
jgi:phosphoribosyl 1,2-cyclic phosphodiesterase